MRASLTFALCSIPMLGRAMVENTAQAQRSGSLDVAQRIDIVQAAFTIETGNANPHRSSVSLPVANATKSFWLDTPHANPLADAGSSGLLTEEADICIIGSGITGASTAWHLSQLLRRTDNTGEPTWSIVILEAREFCSGATGRNGGHLTANPFDSFLERESRDGTAEAVKSYAIEQYTVDTIVRFIKDKGLESAVDLVNGNHVTILRTKEDEDKAQKDWEAATRAGVDTSDKGSNVRWISNQELQEKYGLDSNMNYSGVGSSAYNLWPSKFVTELFKDAAYYSSGVDIKLHTHTPVTGVHRKHVLHSKYDFTRHRRWEAETPRGKVDCAYVVHATNAYTGHLLPFLAGRGLKNDAVNNTGGRPSPPERDPDEPHPHPEHPPPKQPSQIAHGIVPTRGQVGAVRASVKDSELGWLNSWDGGDGGWEYWFPRYPGLPDPTSNPETSDRPLIILGGGRQHSRGTLEKDVMDDSTLNPLVSDALRNFLPSFFPGQFNDSPESWEMQWTGIMGFTLTGEPFVGPLGPLARHLSESSEVINHYDGQYISAGYSGHGMPRAFACAQVVAEQIAAELLHERWKAPAWLPERYLTWAKN